MNDTIFINGKKPFVIAHRGLSGLETENTLASFEMACNKTYYGLECDVHKTIDGKMVVCHDDDLFRVSGVHLNIEKATLKEVKEVSLYKFNTETPSPNLKVPTLEEYIKMAKKYNKKCIVEFKNKFDNQGVYDVVKIIEENNYLDNTIFISFHIENLRMVRQVRNNQKVQYLLSSYIEEEIEKIINEKMDIDIHHMSLTKERVSYLHRNGVLVNTWTVNDLQRAKELISYGVDYITTNILE